MIVGVINKNCNIKTYVFKCDNCGFSYVLETDVKTVIKKEECPRCKTQMRGKDERFE